MRLGEYRDGYLVPYPDVTLLRLEADKFGNFRCGKYFLERVDITPGMLQAFGHNLPRAFYCADKGFADYCQSYWKKVDVIRVPEIPEKKAPIMGHYAVGTCKKCGRTYMIDTGMLTASQVVEKLKAEPFGQLSVSGSYNSITGTCPAGGWHFEQGTMWDNMDFDLAKVYQGGTKK